VEYHNGIQCTGFGVGYRLPDDWMFLHSVNEYRAHCEARLKQRAASISLDTRTVLYGESLLAFIIENADQDPEADAIVDIHRQWLMTPREDLSGHSFSVQHLGRP
jgi:hypothetical protein